MSRLKRLKDETSSTVLFDRQMSYNTANQISQILEPSQTRNFGYDSVDRLTGVTNGTNTATESYAFDGVGNRTSSHASSSYSYQSNNRLTASQSATFAYNAGGNMTSKTASSVTTTFSWDYENRMTSATKGTTTINYKYDALGRRIKRGDGTTTTKFIYDGMDVLADDNAGTLTKYLNGLGIDNKLRGQTGSTINYFLTDHLGSTNGLANSSGSVTSSTSYDSFGSATNTSFPTRYQYTGREFDPFTGLHYYRARWYDAQLGRFISEDPIGFAGGDVNLFGYVKNKPLKHRDPMGLDDADIAFRETDLYKELEKEGKEFWKSVRDSPRPPRLPECGPAEYPTIEYLVSDDVDGYLGPFGSKYKVTPPCESHDTCYSTCGMSKAQCDKQLGRDVYNTCRSQDGTPIPCAFYGGGYYLGVSIGGGGAYESAQKQSGCPSSCSIPNLCSKYGSWACK